MTGIVDRAYEMALSHYGRAPHDGLAHPFGLAEGDAVRWRISPDVHQMLVVALRHPELSVPMSAAESDRLFGLPVLVDVTLPLDSMLLEPIAG